MKLNLLTLNLHCLEEKHQRRNIKLITTEIIKRNIDVVFLQEVAQYHNDSIVEGNIKASNLGYLIQKELQNNNSHYDYSFEPIKYSFNKYDEGLAILSKTPLRKKEVKTISKTNDYYNWLKRKLLKHTTTIKGIDFDLITTHLGWDNEDESFIDQFNLLNETTMLDNTLIGGDFNIPFNEKHYNYIINKKYFDLYSSDKNRQNDPSYENTLDVHTKPSRIDYIFSKKNYITTNQEMLFKNPKVSDHYGLYLEITIGVD